MDLGLDVAVDLNLAPLYRLISNPIQLRAALFEECVFSLRPHVSVPLVRLSVCQPVRLLFRRRILSVT